MRTKRHDHDFYETPPHYIDALLDVVKPSGKIYEPCVGRGNIANRLRPFGRVWTNDIDPKRKATWHRDAANALSWGELGFDWVITNPPFKQELAILQEALRFGKNVAFLARLSFLEPTLTRRGLWRRHSSDLTVIVLPRYSFARDRWGRRQTDSVTCCWLVWREQVKQSAIQISQRREAV